MTLNIFDKKWLDFLLCLCFPDLLQLETNRLNSTHCNNNLDNLLVFIEVKPIVQWMTKQEGLHQGKMRWAQACHHIASYSGHQFQQFLGCGRCGTSSPLLFYLAMSFCLWRWAACWRCVMYCRKIQKGKHKIQFRIKI